MKNKNTKSYILTFTLTLFLVTIFTFVPSPNEMSTIHALRFISSLFGLIIIPGFLLAKIIFEKEKSSISFAFIFGFLLQLLNVYIIWMINIVYSPLNFRFFISTLTIIEVSLMIVYVYIHNMTLQVSKELYPRNLDYVLGFNVMLYLILAFYWQQLSPSPHSDGAAYMDLARNVVKNGVYCSNILFPENTWNYVEFSTGMHTHMFGYFAIALFFALGNVSHFYAKMMLIFTGFLIILLVYHFANRLFNVRVARFATFLIATSPEVLTHVALVGGPEVVSALFMLFAVYILVTFPPHETKLRKTCIVGLSLFISWYAWYFNFFVFITFLPILFAYVSVKNNEKRLSNYLLFLVCLSLFIFEWRVLLNYTYSKIGLHFPSLFMIAVSAYFIKHRKTSSSSTAFLYALTILYFVFYSLVLSSSFTPELRKFVRLSSVSDDLVLLNIRRDIKIISRAFNITDVAKYWNMYWSGIHTYLGNVLIFMSMMSMLRIEKIKETILILSFPLLQSIWWGLFVIIDAFQPRFVVLSSLFYYILTASFIEMLYLYSTEKFKEKNHTFKLTVSHISLNVHKSKLISSTIISYILLIYLIFTFSLYTQQKNVLEFWNFAHNYGWEPAIRWVRENTKSDDVLLTRYGNYWAWLTDRPVVMFTPTIYGSANLTQLLFYIKKFNVKYLIVDIRFAADFPKLSNLYRSPTPFNGSKIVFQYINEKGIKVIIYNVTDISHGILTKNETILPKCKRYPSIEG